MQVEVAGDGPFELHIPANSGDRIRDGDRILTSGNSHHALPPVRERHMGVGALKLNGNGKALGGLLGLREAVDELGPNDGSGL